MKNDPATDESDSASAPRTTPRSKAEQILDIVANMTPNQVMELAKVWPDREPEHLSRFMRALQDPDRTANYWGPQSWQVSTQLAES